MVNDGSISGLEMHTYMENYTSLVVSNGYVYTISMKYGHDFAAMKDGAYNRDVENQRYHERSMEYLNKNGLSETSQSNLQEASEAALLELYGNMVNIAKQKIGEENAKILKLDSNKRVKSTDPC